MLVGNLYDQYEQLSFSGGGLRCFWQGGALDQLRTVLPLAPERIAAASGGALSASCFISQCGEKLIDAFCDRLAPQDRNVAIEPTVDVEQLTPHQEMYRDVVADVLDDAACAAVADGPQFTVLLAKLPERLPTALGAALTLILYKADKLIRSTPHGNFAESIGAEPLRIDAREAARQGCLVDLVCMAATIPPVFNIKDWGGNPVIDAGTVDNAPMPDPNRGRTLVLLTRSYRNLPECDGRTYICPSEATSADKIDFTDAEAVRQTYCQGKSDMAELLERVKPGEPAAAPA